MSAQRAAALFAGIAATHFIVTTLIFAVLFSRAMNQVPTTRLDAAAGLVHSVLAFPLDAHEVTGRVMTSVIWAGVLTVGILSIRAVMIRISAEREP